MPTRYVQRRSALAPGDVSLPNANVVFVDSDDNQLKFTTGSSGTTTVDVVTESQTQTLTNKTLTSPTITTPTVTGSLGTKTTEVVTTTNVITAAESGTTYFLNAAGGFASTLPALAAGLWFEFIVTTAPSGGSYTVLSAAGDSTNEENIFGHVLGSDGNDSSFDAELTGGGTTITFVDGAANIGDRVNVISDGTNWYATAITGSNNAAITITG